MVTKFQAYFSEFYGPYQFTGKTSCNSRSIANIFGIVVVLEITAKKKVSQS